MSLSRQQALHEVLDRVPNHQPRPANKISEYFGENVFNLHVMRSYLPDEAFDGIVEAMEKGTPISRKVADQTASAMKEWAISRGATHYTHWFQPLGASGVRLSFCALEALRRSTRLPVRLVGRHSCAQGKKAPPSYCLPRSGAQQWVTACVLTT